MVSEDMFGKSLGTKVRIFSLDYQYSRGSVCIALSHGIDTLVLTPFLISAVAKHIEELGDRDTIIYIEFHADRAGQEAVDFTKTQFPNAFVAQAYGIGEIGYVSVPCREATLEHPGDIYHGSEEMHLEIIHPDSGRSLPIENGMEGELVCTTTYAPVAFPFIRYRTGDIARVVEAKCSAHNNTWSFSIIGRKDMDFVKIPNGILRVDEVERVLRSLRDKVSDEFELHYSEHTGHDGNPKIKVTLHIEARPGVACSELADEIASKLYINLSFTYARGVESGLYVPLVCVPLKKLDTPRKRKRLIRD